jgi:hypothetical protein
MRYLAPPVIPCPLILIRIRIRILILILIHVQILIRLKPTVWSQQKLILQDIRLILLNTVIYPVLHIGITRLCRRSILQEATTVYTIMLHIHLRSYCTILLVLDLIHTNLTNDQSNYSIRKILNDRTQA